MFDIIPQRSNFESLLVYITSQYNFLNPLKSRFCVFLKTYSAEASIYLSHLPSLFSSSHPPPHDHVPNSTGLIEPAHGSQSPSLRSRLNFDIARHKQTMKNRAPLRGTYYKNQNRMHTFFWLITVVTLICSLELLLLFANSRRDRVKHNGDQYSKLQPLSDISWMTAALNPVISVLMAQSGDSDDEDIFRTPTESSRRTTRQQTASQPPPAKRQYLSLTPVQRLSNRFRRFSEQSDVSSKSGCSSRDSTMDQNSKEQVKKKKRDFKPKAIGKNGVYYLDVMKKTCTVCYMEDFLSSEEAGRLFSTFQEGILKSSHSSNDTTSPLSFDLNELLFDDDGSLSEQITFLKKKIEKSNEQVFDITSPISKVIIRRLPRYKDHIPYESLSEKDDPNPLITILSLGAPRTFNLKKGARVTHKVALHSGSLCIMAGKTSQFYTYSIPRGESEYDNEQLLMFFVGSPGAMTDVESDNSSVSSKVVTSESATEPESNSELDEIDQQSIIEELSILNMSIPQLVVTGVSPDAANKALVIPPETLNITDERISDILEADVALNDDINPHPPQPDVNQSNLEEFELTVINTEVQSQQTQLSVPMQSAPPSSNECMHSNSVTPFSSMIEETLIELKTGMQSLGDQVTSIRRELELKDSKSDVQCGITKHTKEVKELKNLWQQSMDSTEKMKEVIEHNFKDIEVQQVKIDDIKTSVETFMNDLQGYYNSAFFREDSNLIKELHEVVVQEGRRVTCDQSTANPSTSNPQPDETNEHPVMPLFHPSRQQQPTQPGPSTDVETRRSPGFTMTNAGTRMPMPTIHTPGITANAPPSASAPKDASASERPVNRTVLITDSILRHVRDIDSLGTFHELHQINKRDTSGLLDEAVKQKISEIRPDFIYIHLGVNDVTQAIPLRQTILNFIRFKKFTEHQWGTQVIISLPLLTVDPEINERILELRDHLIALVDEFDDQHHNSAPFKKLWVNPNSNFTKDGNLIWDNHSVDGIHLSNEGKNLILGNFRHQIHKMSKRTRPSEFYKKKRERSPVSQV